MSFANLKKQSKLGSLTEKLVKEVEKLNNNSSADERFWKPTMEKNETGSAIIRFLPAPDGEDMPWVKLYSHAFQGLGGWYIENSLTTNGQKDPLGEYNQRLWATGTDSNKEIVRKQKRKLAYYSNIYVVKDPSNPENEGKVFLFKYGKKIYDKILNSMQPEFDDEEPVNPFDFWTGANFRLKIRKVEGYWNYDKSEFDSSGPLVNDDDALETIWKKEYSLTDLVAPDKFKTYEQLQARMNLVLGLNSPSASVQEEAYESLSSKRTVEDNVMEELEESYRKSKSVDTTSSSNVVEDEDDVLAHFKNLIDD
jgi:hypothetical protein